MRGPTLMSSERDAHTRQIKEYRDALRSIGDIARRATRGEGESRFNALTTIDRISAQKLNEL